MSNSPEAKQDNEDEEEGEFGNSLDVDFGDDDEFADEEMETERTEVIETDEEDGSAENDSPYSGGDSGGGETQQKRDHSDIPHRVYTDSPKEGREAINMFIAEEDRQQLQRLKEIATEEFDETVYKMDVYLAALRGSLYNEQEFLNEMREIGYDWKKRHSM